MKNDDGKVTVVVRRKCVISAFVSFALVMLGSGILSVLMRGKPFEIESEVLRTIALGILWLVPFSILTTLLFGSSRNRTRVDLRFPGKRDPRNIY